MGPASLENSYHGELRIVTGRRRVDSTFKSGGLRRCSEVVGRGGQMQKKREFNRAVRISFILPQIDFRGCTKFA